MVSSGATALPEPIDLDGAHWQNLTSWINVTRFTPSIEDLLLAGPRMLTKLGSIIPFPDAIDAFGRGAPDPSAGAPDLFFANPPAPEMAAAAADAATIANVANVALDDPQDATALVSKFSMESAKGLGSVFSYATSKWALCCVAMAIILNRTHIFAASRRSLRLTLPLRILLRILPVVLFLIQARQLLQSIQCQTSPDFSEMRWGNSTKSSALMFAHPGGYLHGVSSTLLLGADDLDSCRAVSMVPAEGPGFSTDLRGSLSRLWPLFGTLCLSHFIETISCAVQGRPVAVETGMTLFEHSLAFAEADAAISNQLGWGLFSGGDASSHVTFQQAGSNVAISRAMVLKRVNTPPEVLFVGFLSAMSHVTSHILGAFGLQSKFRLVNTGFWAVCFMGSIVFEAYNFSIDDPSSMGLFRFPTVCIIGFIPHVMVLGGIMICAFIYGLALLLSALEPPEQLAGRRLTFRERLAQAHGNMQANISLSDIRIAWEMDFYTALLRTGFGVITMASEAVYLNQDRDVTLKERTWLEEERYKELDELRMQWAGSGLGSSRYDSAGAIGLVPVKDSQVGLMNGYARERAAQSVPKGRLSDRRARDGVGASERSSRWLLALDFVTRIFKLVGKGAAVLLLRALSSVGIRWQPRLLVWLSRNKSAPAAEEQQQAGLGTGRGRALQLLIRDGERILLSDENADVEVEVRKGLRRSAETVGMSEKDIDSRLYATWKHGGLWGTVDTSGEWEPEDNDDEWDTTSMLNSVIGDDDNASDRDPWVDEYDDDDGMGGGQRTPTQRSPLGSRESTPMDQPINMSDLSRLLHPQSPEERHEAHALAAHLDSDKIMTRSAYARLQQVQRARLLTSSALLNGHRQSGNSKKLTPEEEAELLEQLIVSRRSSVVSSAASSETQGPQCVVCHNDPRTIIVWPCRCLSLCDDCRVTLAMNNFDKCVCCRREVISFSRIYVP